MDQGARYAQVAAKAGHYESFYIKACEPGGGRGIWIRHTVHKRPGAEPNGSIWFCLFDRAAEGPRATKVTVPAAQLSTPAGSWIRVADAEIGPRPRRGLGRHRGAQRRLVAQLRRRLRALQVPAGRLALRGAAAENQVRRPLAATPASRAAWKSTTTSIELSGWPGMIGHNWGSEHAERWVWLEGTGLRGRRRHLLRRRRRAGQARLPGQPLDPLRDADARRRAPPARRPRRDPLGADRGDAERLRVPPARQGHRRPRPRLGPGEGLRRLGLRRPQGPRAPHRQLLGLRPRADRRTARPARPPAQPRRLARAYELGMRETDHGIPIQPYPDG